MTKKLKFLLLSASATSIAPFALVVSCKDTTKSEAPKDPKPKEENPKSEPTNPETNPNPNNTGDTNNDSSSNNNGNDNSTTTPEQPSSEQGGSTTTTNPSDNGNATSTETNEETTPANFDETNSNALLSKVETLISNFNEIEFTNYSQPLSTALNSYKAVLANADSTAAQKQEAYNALSQTYKRQSQGYNKTNILNSIREKVKYIQEQYIKTSWFTNPISAPALELLLSVVIRETDKAAEASEVLKRVLVVYNQYLTEQDKLDAYIDLIKVRTAAWTLLKRFDAIKGENNLQSQFNEFKEEYNSHIATLKYNTRGYVSSYTNLVLFTNTKEEIQENAEFIKKFVNKWALEVSKYFIKNIIVLAKSNSSSRGNYFTQKFYAPYFEAIKKVGQAQVSENPTNEEAFNIFNSFILAEDIKTNIENKFLYLVKQKNNSFNLWKEGDQEKVILETTSSSSRPISLNSKAAPLPIAYESVENFKVYNKIVELRNLVIKTFFTLQKDAISGISAYVMKDFGSSATKVNVSQLLNSIDFAIQAGMVTEDVYDFLYGEGQDQFFANIPLSRTPLVLQYYSYTKIKHVMDETSSSSTRPSAGSNEV
ncbi:hypothetical protein [Mycoplasmopsis gallopavonis]|uniref:Lipoprotein n=1 Tax=Mycoplasmopsis gallopavonis TaxID=76629 RepID=A0A449AZR3_9BACT|nr:hypothetical protein [Mycoplasmopsis gallopavonis]RIV16235.1 hypothetical protein D1113_03120 [Mycoplasmopsis gallopavonis]VEU73003.1 Uncharacterised protein [Mycoplasmopsis gallopavonis]VEU73305.1 Uncharacterised protein [Mycoplasmopsis gallopavonis]